MSTTRTPPVHIVSQ